MIQPDILFFSWQDLNTLRVSHGNLCKLSFTPQGENVCQFSLTTFFHLLLSIRRLSMKDKTKTQRCVGCCWRTRSCAGEKHTHMQYTTLPPLLLHNQALESSLPSSARWLWELYFGIVLVLARLQTSGSSISVTGLSFLLTHTQLCASLVVKLDVRGRID